MTMYEMMPRNLLAGLSALIVAGALQPAAEAKGKESVLFAQGSSIWRTDIEGKGKPVELVQVGQGTVTRIHASDEGDTLLIEKDDEVLWARPGRGSKPVPARPLDCKPHAHLAADGKHAACMDQSGNRVLIRLDPSPRKTVYGAAIHTHIGFGGKTMISSDDKGVWAAPSGRSGRALLAREPPQSHLLVAPDGKRAVGVYLEDRGHALYTFRLDGKGVRRRLMKDATPLAWSRDSRWLLVQDGKSACIVRAAGGQYKCWRRYQAVDISPDGSHVLLVKENDDDKDNGKRKRKSKRKSKRKDRESSRGNDASPGEFGLYRGRRDGVKPDSPTLVRSQVHPAAAWLGK